MKVFVLLFFLSFSATTFGQQIDVWLGTGNGGGSKGIYHCKLNTQNGRLSDPTVAAEMKDPGFLARHPSRPIIYAVGGLDGESVVAAFQIKGRSLDLMNAVPIGNGGACHVAVDDTGQTLLTAQYGTGSVAVFRLNEDGSIKQRTQIFQHEGGSRVFAGRQEKPHAHWVGFSPDQKFAFVPDLGLDAVVVYRCDVANAKLETHGKVAIEPGGGPRHMKFHPNGKWAYVLQEMSLKVTAFNYDAANGAMTPVQTIETVSREALAKETFKTCSEIRVHPNGRFVYAANRGHDTITAFEVDQQTGKLTLIELEHVRGATPRNFNLDPSGKWLLAGGQKSHTLSSFAVEENGELTFNQHVVHAPACICVLFEHE